jgi:hypothetical protein
MQLVSTPQTPRRAAPSRPPARRQAYRTATLALLANGEGLLRQLGSRQASLLTVGPGV